MLGHRLCKQAFTCLLTIAAGIATAACGSTGADRSETPTTGCRQAQAASVIHSSRVPEDEAVFGGPGAQRMMGVAHGNGMWVAVGTDTENRPLPRDVAAVWTSPDGRRWNRIPNDPDAFSAEGSLTMSDVAFGDGQWVAVGDVLPEPPSLQQPAVWTSRDGERWTRDSSTDWMSLGESRMNSIAWDNGTWIAAGWVRKLGRTALWTSHDARTWTLLSNSPRISTEDGSNEAVAIAAAGPQWLLIGQVEYGDTGHNAQRVWVSDDARRWRREPSFIVQRYAADAEIIDVAWADGHWLAVGRAVDSEQNDPNDELGSINGGVWTSTDATSWERVREPAFEGTGAQILRSVAWSEGRGMTVGSEEIGNPSGGGNGAAWSLERPACR
jgi:hypothetical protein